MCEEVDTSIERLGDSWSSLSTGSANAFGGGRSHLSFSKFGGQNTMMLSENFEPGEYDVICGRGKKSFHHLGNSYLRDVVTGCLERYANASKVEKSVILCEVVDQIRRSSPNGGFVKKDATTGRWHPVDDFLAREKTSQAFRDALTDLYKSSNSSKKKRRQAERTGRQLSQYKPERSSSTEDLLASDQASLGYTASTCSTTTNGSNFVPPVPTLATVFTPSAAVMRVSALMGGIPLPVQGSTISKSKKIMGSSSTRSLQLQQKQEVSTKSLQLQHQQEPMQQQSARPAADPLRHSCPNIKFNFSSGGHELVQGALPLPSLSMQQQLLTKSLQLQVLQEPQQLEQQSTQPVMDPLRRSCPNIKINCDIVGVKRRLQLESHAKELDMTRDDVPFPQEPKPMQQPFSNIKFDCDATNDNGRFQLKRHAEDLAQGLPPLVGGPQPLQQLSAPSVADRLRRSCPNIKFFSDIGSFQLERDAEEIDISQGVVPNLHKPQLREPFARPDKLRRSCPNIKFDSRRSFYLANKAEDLDITQDSDITLDFVPLLQEGQETASRHLDSSSQPNDNSASAHSLPNFDEKTSEHQQQQHHDNIAMDEDDFQSFLESTEEENFEMDDIKYMADDDYTLDDADDSMKHEKSEMPQAGDMLFDRLAHFAESSGRACGNPFEPDPIPEKV